MDIKVNEMTPAAAVDTATKAPEGDGSFKFTLTSAISESGGADCAAHGYQGHEKIPRPCQRFFE